MDANLYTLEKHPCELLEVVDNHNHPLCLMPEAEIVRQHLLHRAVGLLIRDTAGRALLSSAGGEGWGLSSFRRVPAGLSSEEMARRLLLEDWGESGFRLLPLGLCPPCPESHHAFVALFEARLPAALATQKALDPDLTLLLDYDELKGMTTHFGDLLSPFLRVAVQSGHARPL